MTAPIEPAQFVVYPSPVLKSEPPTHIWVPVEDDRTPANSITFGEEDDDHSKQDTAHIF